LRDKKKKGKKEEKGGGLIFKAALFMKISEYKLNTRKNDNFASYRWI